MICGLAPMMVVIFSIEISEKWFCTFYYGHFVAPQKE